MIRKPIRPVKQVRTSVGFAIVAVLLVGTAGTVSSHIRQPIAGRSHAVRVDCAPEVMPFVRALVSADQLRGRQGVALLSQRAFIVASPSRMRFQRFAAGAMRGVLSDGCPFAFWRTGHPASIERGEIRIPRLEELSGPGWSFLGQSPGPPPRSVPAFEGYRHVASGAADRGNPATAVADDAPYVGLWHRNDGGAGTLIAYHRSDGGGVIRLGTVGRTYDAVYAAQGIHDISFTLVKEPTDGEPLHIVTFSWSEPGACCRARRRSERSGRRNH